MPETDENTTETAENKEKSSKKTTETTPDSQTSTTDTPTESTTDDEKAADESTTADGEKPSEMSEDTETESSTKDTPSETKVSDTSSAGEETVKAEPEAIDVKAVTFEQFSSLFEIVKPDTVQVHSLTYYEEGMPYFGKPVKGELVGQLDENAADDADFFANYTFTIDDNYDAYIVREGEDMEEGLNCTYLYIYNKNDNVFTTKHKLSCISTSGLLYQNTQAWITYLNDDDYPDIVQRVIVTHYAGLNNDVIIGKVWQGTDYIDYDLSKKEEQLKSKYKLQD